MEDSVQKILESIPAEEPRSRLELHRELILRLRRDGRTYRRIVGILKEKCGVIVTTSTLHEFVQRRSRPRKAEPEIAAQQPSTTAVIEAQPQAPALIEAEPPRTYTKLSPEERAEQLARARAWRTQPAPTPPQDTRELFVYDPTKPLVKIPTKE